MTFGGDDEQDVSEAGLEELRYRLWNADSIGEVANVIDAHGWGVPLVLLGVLGVIRGAFEYLVEPFVISEGYIFPGWPFAVFTNLVYGFFLVAFAWFMFFGVIGGLAGYLSDVRDMDTVVFKIGSYFSLVFVPIFVFGSAIMLTVTVPESAGLPSQTEGFGLEEPTAYAYVYDTTQFHVVQVLRAIGWAVVGFLMLPVVEHRYELSRKRSVLVVLPVTLAAIISTQLI